MKNLYTVLILPLLLLLTSQVYSQWSRTGGPSGGYVYAIDANSQYLFAGTKNGIYRSGDEGMSWQRLNNGLPDAFFCYEIKSSGNNILLWGKDNNYNEVSNHDVFKSNNNGEDWVEITLPDTIRYLDEIALHGNKVFIAEDNILKTEDDGLTWSEILSEEVCPTVQDMEVYDDKLLVLCKNLLVTSDFGNSWVNLTVPKGEGIYLKDTLMILMIGNNAFRSINNGTTWETVNGWQSGNSSEQQIVAVNNILYTGADNILRSLDDGLNWEEVPSDTNFYSAYGITNLNGNLFTSSLYDGINQYIIDEEKYAKKEIGVDASVITSLAVHGKEIWAGHTNGLSRYDMTTQTWDPANYFPQVYEFLDVDWLGNQMFVVNYHNHVYRSTDNGLTWKDVTPFGVGLFANLLVEDQTLYLFGISGRLEWESKNGGDTWGSPFPDFDEQVNRHIRWLAHHNDNVFITSDASVFRSQDAGLTWESKDNGIDVAQCFITQIMSVGDYLFIESFKPDPNSFEYKLELYVSDDDGENWEVAMNGLPNLKYTSVGPSAEIVNFRDTLVMTLADAGIYYSKVDDLAWRQWSNDEAFLFGSNALALAQDKLFAGTNGVGVWQLNATGIQTGIHQSEEDIISLQILPNPASSDITLFSSSNELRGGFIFIYNLQGEVVYFNKASADVSKTIEIDHLVAGEYFVRVEANDEVYGGKFVKQ